MSKKIETVLRIIAIVSLILGAWALTLNQFSAFVENGKEAKVAQAVGECIQFQAAHAVIVDGVAYCYTTPDEMIAPLESLKKASGDEPTSEQGEG